MNETNDSVTAADAAADDAIGVTEARRPKGLLALAVLSLIVAGAALALAFDARSQLEQVRGDLAEAEAEVEAAFDDSTEQFAEDLQAVAPAIREAREAARRVDDLESALFGSFGSPPFSGFVYDLESQIFELSDTVQDLESCMSSISGYLDFRTQQFFCRYL